MHFEVLFQSKTPKLPVLDHSPKIYLALFLFWFIRKCWCYKNWLQWESSEIECRYWSSTERGWRDTLCTDWKSQWGSYPTQNEWLCSESGFVQCVCTHHLNSTCYVWVVHIYECNVSSKSTHFSSPAYYIHTFNHKRDDTDQTHVGICNMMISVCQCTMYRGNEIMYYYVRTSNLQ